jgi:arylsulfatase A-like enzyme
MARFVLGVALGVLVGLAGGCAPEGSGGPSGASSAEAPGHVVVIAIDGLPAYLLKDEKAPIPTLRMLAEQGASAQGMRVSNPAVTWPNHTTLVSGVHPEKHSVLFNGILKRKGPGQEVVIEPNHDKSALVAVPTLFDHAHAAGLATAGINWPCTRSAAMVHDNWPDVPKQITHMSPRLRQEMVAAKVLAGGNDASFYQGSPSMKDQQWTAASVHVIKQRKPHFMAIHMLVCDTIHHKYGAQSFASYAALAQVDAQVREVLRALDEAGIRQRTTVFIVSDHGFETITKLLLPNVLFRKEGLLNVSTSLRITKARAQIISEGGIAMVYFSDPATAKEDRAEAIELLKDREGIAEILQPEQYAQYGLPHPSKNQGMGDLVLVARPGYGFSNTAHGENYVMPVVLGTQNVGIHGCISTYEKMDAAFIASGRGVKPGVKLDRVIENIDIAPTAAHLLGIQMAGVDGKVLTEILAGK